MLESKKLLLLQVLAVACYANNIDVVQPILRESPDVFQNGSLFGYSLALHQVAAASNPTEALANTRIVVTAPKRNTEGGVLKGTGAVYVCPVNPGPCARSSYPRLYDTEGNVNPENKTNQFLGASISSDGENLLVCAHRYNIRLTSNNILTNIVMTGRCFASSNRDLTSFNDFQPCRQVDDLNILSSGFCQAGISSVVLPGPVYGLGAPGYFIWRGNLISMTSNSRPDISRLFGEGAVDDVSYLGYATTSGFFAVNNRLDYAVSVPRFGRYTGAVHIVLRDNGLTLVSQAALRGSQMGEGYGFSVLGANLRGDSLSELIVGAPFYRANRTQADVGRVFIYTNRRGSLVEPEPPRMIEGFKAFSRFGYAMANLGDINRDGYDDIAISAPFSNTGESGTVYIFHSSSSMGLTLSPQQIIEGSRLNLMGIDPFTGFGAALASGVDVDGNTYNDLAVGTYSSQKVFLLRTRPVAETTVTFTADDLIVDLDNRRCMFNSEMLACFTVEACASYTGPGLSNQLTYDFTLDSDVGEGIERRLFFNNSQTSVMFSVALTPSTKICQSYTVYVTNGVQDRFDPFIMTYGLMIPQPSIATGNGNLAPESFDNYPVLQTSGTTRLQVETLKDCNGTVCVPDLSITVMRTSTTNMDGSTGASTIVVGGVRSVQVSLEVMNLGEDAFRAAVFVTFPPQLEFSRASGTFNNGMTSTLTCSTPVREGSDMTSSTRCDFGNPFSGPGNRVEIVVTLLPRSTLLGDENDVTVGFRASSVNVENGTLGNNMASATLGISARADITIDAQGIVSPEQLTYSRTPPTGNITRVDQLGPRFSVSFVVRNSGPSTVGRIRLVINWPLNGSNTDGFYYLYPAQFSTSETGSTITCMNQNINPRNLALSADGNSENSEMVTTPTDGKRRRKRSAHRVSKRQNIAVPANPDSNTVEVSTVNQTISCANTGVVLNCVPIECTIIGLQGSSSAQARVNIIGYIDERFFSKSVDRFSILPNATVAIVGGDFIEQPNPNTGKNATATVRLIPAAVVVVGERRAVPWYVIVLPIVAALIVIVVVTVILWALGFFKRKKHEEIKQKREELENLEEHGIAAGGASSTENIIAS